MKKIQIIQGTTLKGDVVDVGQILDVDDGDARILISQQQAVLYVPPPPAKPKVPVSPEDYGNLTVKTLLAIAKDKGIDVPAAAKKDEIIELLTAPKAPEPPDYEKMSVDELLKLAEEREIEIPAGAEKDEIIELLTYGK